MKKIKSKISMILALVLIIITGIIATACGFSIMDPPDGAGNPWDRIDWEQILRDLDWTEILTQDIIDHILANFELEDFFTPEELREFMGPIDEEEIRRIVGEMDIEDLICEDEFRELVRRAIFEYILEHYSEEFARRILLDILTELVSDMPLLRGLFHAMLHDPVIGELLFDFISNSVDLLDLISQDDIDEILQNLITQGQIEQIMRAFLLSLDIDDLRNYLFHGVDLTELFTDPMIIELLSRIDLVDLFEDDLMELILSAMDDDEVLEFLLDALLASDYFIPMLLANEDFEDLLEDIIRRILAEGGGIDWGAIREEIRQEFLLDPDILIHPMIVWLMGSGWTFDDALDWLVEIELERRIRDGEIGN